MTEFLALTVVGIVTGAIYGVAASGLVVTYTTSGIFNFAHGAMGMFMAFVYWQLSVRWGWPVPISLAVVLLVLAPLLGAVVERLLMRRLHGSSTGVALVVTLGLLVVLLGVAQSIWPPSEARAVAQLFPGRTTEIAGVVVTYHELTVIGFALVTSLVLRLLLFRTRIGVTMRAVVDNRELSAMNGASPERVGQLAWALGASLAAAAGILIAPQITLDHLGLTLLVVNAYAAAVLGRLRSLPLTFVGALILGLLYSYSIGYGSRFEAVGNLAPVLPTLFLFGVLVFLPHARLRTGPVIGMHLPRVPSLRQTVVTGAAFVFVVAVVSGSLSEFWTFNFASALVIGIVLLSLVLLTGYAGQVSLTQMAFVGIGALMMGRLGGGGSPLGLAGAALVAGAFGALVALPALRLQNLYLALATLAAALFAQWAFNERWLFDRGGILEVDRLRVFGLEARTERSQLVLVATVFALVAILVLAIRRGSFGRRLAAMSDSPIACATLGISLVGTKTAVFAISAAIAGVAGALFGGVRTSVSAQDFVMLQSLFVFLVATFGGINTVIGALFGGAFLVLVPELQKELDITNLQYLGIGIGAIVLANNPNGFGGDMAHLGERLRPALARALERRSSRAADVPRAAEEEGVAVL